MQVRSLESFYLGISKTNKMIPINQTVSVKWMLDRVPRACSKIEFQYNINCCVHTCQSWLIQVKSIETGRHGRSERTVS